MTLKFLISLSRFSDKRSPDRSFIFKSLILKVSSALSFSLSLCFWSLRWRRSTCESKYVSTVSDEERLSLMICYMMKRSRNRILPSKVKPLVHCSKASSRTNGTEKYPFPKMGDGGREEPIVLQLMTVKYQWPSCEVALLLCRRNRGDAQRCVSALLAGFAYVIDCQVIIPSRMSECHLFRRELNPKP